MSRRSRAGRKFKLDRVMDLFRDDKSEVDDGEEEDDDGDEEGVVGTSGLFRQGPATIQFLEDSLSESGDDDYEPPQRLNDNEPFDQEEMELDNQLNEHNQDEETRTIESKKFKQKSKLIWVRGTFQTPDEDDLKFCGPIRVVPLDENGQPQPPIWYFRQFFTENIVTLLAFWSKNYFQKTLCMEEQQHSTSFQVPTPITGRRCRTNPPDLRGICVSVSPSTSDPSPAPSVSLISTAPKKNCKSRTFDGQSVVEISSDIDSLCAILLTMGIWQHKNVLEYWHSQRGISHVKDMMAQDRFRFLVRYLCLRNVNDIEPTDEQKKIDRAWKARPFIELIREKLRAVENEEHQAIDEQMIKFYGRNIMRQYMPKKPTKWGFKTFARAGKSGFVYDFDLALGKSTTEETKAAEEVGLSITAFVVWKLVAKMGTRYKGCKLFADRYFTSIALARKLLENGHFYIGTIDNNRIDCAPLKKDKDLPNRGDMDYILSDDRKLALIRWKDNKAVTLLSTYKCTDPTSTIKRYDKKRKEKVDVTCPAVIHEYNQNMGGVDFSDYLREMYKFSLKSRRWYIYLFSYILQLSVRNAAILYQRDMKLLGQNKSLDLKSFIWNVRNALATKSSYVRKRAIDRPADECRLDELGHLPDIHRGREGGADSRHRCALCSKGKTNIWCLKCEVPLCLQKDRNCFLNYHSRSVL